MTELTFQALRAAGFRHLLPIIPHDATISEYSRSLQGREDMLGKTPGKAVSDGWVGLAGWQGLTATDDDLAEWQTDGAGIGLRCEDVVAVDIDVTEPGLSNLIRAEAFTWLGIAPTRYGNRPKALLLFRLDQPGSWPTKKRLEFHDWDGEKHAVEILGARQQFVVHGIHPKTRRPYEWDADLLEGGLAGLPVVNPEELDTFLAKVQSALEMFDCAIGKVQSAGATGERSAEGLMCTDTALLSQAVATIPNPETTTREEFVAMAHAVHAATGGSDEGLEIFTEWAERWPLAQADGEVERVYHSVQGSSIGVQWLLDKARAHGFDNAAAEFEGTAVPEKKHSPFWDDWVYVNSLKRFINLRSGLWLDKEQFNDVFHGQVGDDDTKPAAFFIEHRRSNCFADTMDYRPGDCTRVWYDARRHQTLFNAWTPGPAHSGEWDVVPEDQEALRLWLQLGEHLFPDRAEREHLLDWMAFLLQCPGVKPNWHPLIGGDIHGTGKDSFFIPLQRGLGHNAVSIEGSELESQWTWWAENVQLVTVSEVNSFERRALMNKMKSLMASPPYTIDINKKGMPQYSVPNLFAMLMFTNNRDAMAIERSDRRVFVLWVTAGKLEDEWYTRYHELFTYSDVGPATVARWLRARAIQPAAFKGSAPMTAAKDEMRLAALGPLEGALIHGMENEEGPFAFDVFAISEVKSWLSTQGLRLNQNEGKIAAILKREGCRKLGKTRCALPGRPSGLETLYAAPKRAGMLEDLAATKGILAVRDKLMREREAKTGPVAEFSEGATA